MSVWLALLMAATAALLAISVCAVLWRKNGARSSGAVQEPSKPVLRPTATLPAM